MTFKDRDFLKLLDFTPEEIEYLIDFAASLKAKKKAGIPHKICDGKNVALIFEKTSTRTRCSFEVEARDLGMGTTYLDPSGSQIGNIDLSLHRQETSVDIVMLINVTTKQNTINLMFQTLEKSTDARSLNSKKGKGILNTNLFILFAKSSSKIPTLRRKSPNTIIRKIGPVAFRQNIKFSISN